MDDEDEEAPVGPAPKKRTPEEQTAILKKQKTDKVAAKKAGRQAELDLYKMVASIRDGIRTCRCADSNTRVILTFLFHICSKMKFCSNFIPISEKFIFTRNDANYELSPSQ